MKAYGMPPMVWRDEYAPATRTGHQQAQRSRYKRALRRIHKRLARAEAKRQIIDAREDTESSCRVAHVLR